MTAGIQVVSQKLHLLKLEEEAVSCMHPFRHFVVRVFLRTEEMRARGVTVDLLVCHTIFSWPLDGYLVTFLALIFCDLYR